MYPKRTTPRSGRNSRQEIQISCRILRTGHPTVFCGNEFGRIEIQTERMAVSIEFFSGRHSSLRTCQMQKTCQFARRATYWNCEANLRLVGVVLPVFGHHCRHVDCASEFWDLRETVAGPGVGASHSCPQDSSDPTYLLVSRGLEGRDWRTLALELPNAFSGEMPFGATERFKRSHTSSA